MASKKDKLGQAARSRIDESMGKPEEKLPRSNMEEFVRDMKGEGPPAGASEKAEPVTPPVPPRNAEASPGEETKRVSRQDASSETGRRHPGMEMKKSRRDSIYNISSDIRLEDYTDGGSGSSGGGIGGKSRIIAGIALVGLLGTGIYYFAGWLFAPSFILAVAQEDLTAENIEEIAARDAVLSAGEPVHIRFQWEEDQLKATYLRIKVDRVEGGSAEEEAILGQKPPRTATYIYFKGPLDPGDYHVEVQDESGSILEDKEFKIR